MVSIESDRLILESGKQYKMTLSELSPAPAVASQSTLSAPTGWTDKGVPMGQNLLASRLDARTKMRMSVQEARMRAKLPPSERLPPVLKLSPRANIEPHKEIAAKEILPVEIVNPGTPPPPCNAFDVKKDRSLINNLIRETEFQDQNGNEKKMMEPSKKFVKHICGWNLDYDKYHLKTRSTENRTVCTAKTPQKRTIPSTPTLASDLKIKINLYDRYTANSVGAIFKFFHYADLRLYIKQYRRNHSCGVGQRTHLTSVSPVYENNMYRLTGPPEHTPYYYNATKARDGFVLGVQSTPVTPNIWKANANLPLPSAFRQRYSRERRPPAEEPILSPRVFVRQNGAFAQFWKTRDDGTPDPSIAVTRPPTTQTQRPSCTGENKGNQKMRPEIKTTKSPELHGDLQKETSTWRIMQMIASCSIPSRTDGSDLTTTKECTSPTLDTDSSRSLEKSPDTGEMTFESSISPETSGSDREIVYAHSSENRFMKLQSNTKLFSSIQKDDRPVVYNRTRSILSNMSNLLSHYIESENVVPVDAEKHQDNSPELKEQVNSALIRRENEEYLNTNMKNRNQIAQLRKDLRNIASRKSPPRQKMPSPRDLTKLGSLVLLEKATNVRHPKRCNSTPQQIRKTHQKEIRRISPSPAKTGHAGYRRVVREAEQKDEEKPILFVKRSHLLPTVSASVEAMKSRQIILQRRHAHPADSKQFTKITDLLRNQNRSQDRIKVNTPNTATGRRVTTRSYSLSDSRVM
ncbi:uncharacterized protein LOC144422921 isoform X1 [Styela clava]